MTCGAITDVDGVLVRCEAIIAYLVGSDGDHSGEFENTRRLAAISYSIIRAILNDKSSDSLRKFPNHMTLQLH